MDTLETHSLFPSLRVCVPHSDPRAAVALLYGLHGLGVEVPQNVVRAAEKVLLTGKAGGGAAGGVHMPVRMPMHGQGQSWNADTHGLVHLPLHA